MAGNTKTIISSRTRPFDIFTKTAIYFSTGLTVIILISMIAYIIARGAPQISWQFLSKAPSALKGTYGILPSIINTLYIIVVTLIIATPVGVGSAIYLNEYARKGAIVKIIEGTIEILAGIPSIIYGLFGAIFFGEIMQLKYSILTGALTLTIMVLPVVIRTTQEALKTVPYTYREGALGIGATKWYMIRTIILPSSLSGIITAIILSIGRIVGESAALIFTAGAASNLPKSFFGHVLTSGSTLTVQMYFGVANGKYIDQGFGVALVLVIIVLLINTITRVLSNRFKKQ